MEYKKINDKYIVRIDKGEEIVSSIKKFCETEDIKVGSVYGLGATNNVELGLFKTSTKEYLKKIFSGDFEMTSIVGNISTMNDEIYLHIHVTIGNEKYEVYGGHLSFAVVSGTCELVITKIDSILHRKYDDNVGLNLYDF